MEGVGFVLYANAAVVRSGNGCLERASDGWRRVASDSVAPFDIKVCVGSRGPAMNDANRVKKVLEEACFRSGGSKELADATFDAAEWMQAEFRNRLDGKYAECAISLRLALLRRTQCPRVHYDSVPLRALATLVGPGTDYAPDDAVNWNQFRSILSRNPRVDNEKLEVAVVPSGLIATPEYHALFLAPPTLHRSPRWTDTRVILQVDVDDESV